MKIFSAALLLSTGHLVAASPDAPAPRPAKLAADVTQPVSVAKPTPVPETTVAAIISGVGFLLMLRRRRTE